MKIELFDDAVELDSDFIEDRKQVQRQIQEYLDSGRTRFETSYSLAKLTDHQQKVLEETSEIPLGKTRTYSEIAEEISSAPVAVGQALKTNPLPVLIPCHRVVGENNLGGYNGEKNSSIKKKLLEHERSLIK